MTADEHALTGLTTRHVQTPSKAGATLAGTRVLTVKHGGAGYCALSRLLQVARGLELMAARTLNLNTTSVIVCRLFDGVESVFARGAVCSWVWVGALTKGLTNDAFKYAHRCLGRVMVTICI